MGWPARPGCLREAESRLRSRSSAGRPLKRRVSLCEPIAVRLQRQLRRDVDRAVVHPLEAVQEHRSVLFVEDRLANLDRVVGPHGQEVPVIRGVVELAERQAV